MKYTVEDIKDVITKQKVFKAKVIDEDKEVKMLEFNSIVKERFSNNLYICLEVFDYIVNRTPIGNIVEIIED